MDLRGITISEEEIRDKLQQTSPGLPAFDGKEPCDFYKENKAIIEAGIEILKHIYPLAGYGCAGLAVIFDKYCNEIDKQ